MKEKLIRVGAGALFFAGFPWAIVFLVVLPFTAFEVVTEFIQLMRIGHGSGALPFATASMVSIWILVGYYVWIGWYLRMGEPSNLKGRTHFWVLSALQTISFPVVTFFDPHFQFIARFLFEGLLVWSLLACFTSVILALAEVLWPNQSGEGAA